MSEYWVSKKKYFCKYCDIYIADDAPSRQHHESGMRHKGNVERYIRQIYKTGEKQKKDLEEEKREMKRIEQAANAAFAQDVSSGVAQLATPPIASTSKAPKPAKPSNPFANYSTAASLGYTDPDAERIAAELERKKTEGVAGEWEIITPVQPPASVTDTEEGGQGQGQEEQTSLKREAAAPPEEEDTRSFKLRKKTVSAGLGQIYDPGVIPVKIKKKEPAEPSPSIIPADTSDKKPGLALAEKWNPVQLKRAPGSQDEGTPSTSDNSKPRPSTSTPRATNSKWTKAQWSEPLQDLKAEERFSIFRSVDDSKVEPSGETMVSLQTEVKEEDVKPKPDMNTVKEESTSFIFKKRKTPLNAGARGRRQA